MTIVENFINLFILFVYLNKIFDIKKNKINEKFIKMF